MHRPAPVRTALRRHLADVLNDAISGGIAIATTDGGDNYAFGGARSLGGNDVRDSIYSLR
jgi:hypothetical protein